MSSLPMSTLLTAALISLTQLLLFSVCGLGLARLLLPPRLRAHELTLAPLFGLGLLVIAVLRRRDGRRLPGVLPARELLPLLLLMLGGWLLSLAPLINYGALIPIGHNWDVEFYLPLAAYLKDYSYATLAQAPANPLRDLVLSQRIVSRAMGATYAQSMADLLGGWDAWDSWVPMLALLRALTLPGLYALLRE